MKIRTFRRFREFYLHHHIVYHILFLFFGNIPYEILRLTHQFSVCVQLPPPLKKVDFGAISIVINFIVTISIITIVVFVVVTTTTCFLYIKNAVLGLRLGLGLGLQLGLGLTLTLNLT